MRKIFIHTYNDIITVENLLYAWEHFRRDKKSKTDVQEFERDLMQNIIALYNDLKNKTYQHGTYQHFKISDPKSRDIHKALVRDRIVHHLLYTRLYPFFDQKFISDSYSCRLGKGTHKGVIKLREYILKVSKNHTRPCYVLKCDIRKFFASIDHLILKSILAKYIFDQDILKLLYNIIDSFHTSGKLLCGLPLGNLTSQLLVNIYMNIFDQYVKHTLKHKYYIRYADDFVIISQHKGELGNLIPEISKFLSEDLKLDLHPNKVFIRKLQHGIDFLGWVEFGTHRVLRTSTKNRMFRNLLEKQGNKESAQSYLGMISHGNGYRLSKKIEEIVNNEIGIL